MTPRIYVASVSDYNAGRLHGAWIDADRTADELHQAIEEMLHQSTTSHAEEWAIHDYDGFGVVRLSEFESLEVIGSIAAGIIEHGPAFAVLIDLVGADSMDSPRFFEDRFLGRYASMEELAEQIAVDRGWPEQIERLDACLRPYVSISYSRLGRDLGSGLDLVDAKDGGIFVFDTR
jgi:antirestriction protein